jgi:hypothetical protein
MKAKIYALSTMLADENGPAMPAVSSPGTETSLGSRRHSSSACGLAITRSRYRSIRSRCAIEVDSSPGNASACGPHRAPARTGGGRESARACRSM